MKHTLLNIVLVCTGVLVGVSSIGAVYVLNERRDDQMRLIQRTEAWAAKRDDLIPTVNCQTAIPKPSIPPP